jgi:hypothetical protein
MAEVIAFADAFWLGCGALDSESHIQVDILTRDDTPVPLLEVVPERGESDRFGLLRELALPSGSREGRSRSPASLRHKNFCWTESNSTV